MLYFMLKNNIYFLLIMLKGLFCSCDKGYDDTRISKNYKIAKIAGLPYAVQESSGLEKLNNDTMKFFTHNDGNHPYLYKINPKGKYLRRIRLPVKVHDWEDIASDNSGNIYIGDFGNNFNKRKNLQIIKYNLKTKACAAIKFKYEDQTKFPPASKNLNYDCEAMFWYQDSLYLFSKNRGKKIVKCYTIPDKAGKYTAKIHSKRFLKTPVTGADISPDKTQFTLLTYGNIFIFSIKNQKISLQSPVSCLSFPQSGQAEGIAFINNNDLLISNEGSEIFIAIKRNSSLNKHYAF